MKTDNAIFIFTKDRPLLLKDTLKSVLDLDIRIFLIDDSYFLRNQNYNKQLSNKIPQVSYWGIDEFNSFIDSKRIFPSNIEFKLKSPGQKKWNLGNVRNFALLLANQNNIEKTLFLDDDIIFEDPYLVYELFKYLDKYLFVGAKVLGMLDTSIIGHVSLEMGFKEYHYGMLSGGCLAFKPQQITIPFTNIYNEDWIWMILQNNNDNCLEYGSVIQSQFDPYKKFKSKILFQEFGEMVFDGLVKRENNQYNNLLVQDSFWNAVLIKRIEYIDLLLEKVKLRNHKKFLMILRWLKYNLEKYEPQIFKNYFDFFFVQIKEYQHLCKMLSK